MNYNDFTSIYSDEFNYDEEAEFNYNNFIKKHSILDYEDMLNTDDLVY